MDPDPSFVVVEGGFDLAESVVLFYFLEGNGGQGVGVVGHHARGLVDIEVAALFDFALPGGVFFVFHQLSYVLEVGLSEFVAVHGHVNIEFFNL